MATMERRAPARHKHGIFELAEQVLGAPKPPAGARTGCRGAVFNGFV